MHQDSPWLDVRPGPIDAFFQKHQQSTKSSEKFPKRNHFMAFLNHQHCQPHNTYKPLCPHKLSLIYWYKTYHHYHQQNLIERFTIHLSVCVCVFVSLFVCLSVCVCVCVFLYACVSLCWKIPLKGFQITRQCLLKLGRRLIIIFKKERYQRVLLKVKMKLMNLRIGVRTQK